METIQAEIEGGRKHHAAGRLSEAERHYRRALQLSPDNADALHLLGVIAHQRGDNEQALRLIDAAIQRQPANARFFCHRGNALDGLRRFQEAVASYDAALAIAPTFAEANYNRGLALQRLGRSDDAIAAYDRALQTRPDYVEAMNNRGIALSELKRHREAIDSYDRLLSLAPRHAAALTNRASALQELKRFDEALTDYDAALRVDPGNVNAFANRANALQKLGRHRDALADYARALELAPDNARARVNQGLCRLTLGDFEAGWPGYEWRWRVEKPVSPVRDFTQPVWRGEDLGGKTILLHAEQGFGDAIQFLRYVPMVAAWSSAVVLEVPRPLFALATSVAGAKRVIVRGEALPPFDVHCPLASLPLAFATSLETIPSTVPYLAPPPGVVKRWKAELGRRKHPRIGIVWAGSATDPDRSIGLKTLLTGVATKANLVSLQKDAGEQDKRSLASARIPHLGDRVNDFADTAALIHLMDAVISIDTAVAHLAGALGKVTWILLPFAADWRWLLDRSDSPWYPTARLFRQRAVGNWGAPLAELKREISRL